MAVQTQKNLAQSQKTPVFKRPEFRVSLVISVLVVLTASITLSFLAANRSLFSGNAHFTLNHILVNSTGYWRANDKEITRILELDKGVTNLFDIDLSDIVKRLRQEPNIDKVSVSRILPDTLRIDIGERIPRAFLYSPNSGWVVDSEAILMESKKVLPAKGAVPVITGLRLIRETAPGAVIPELRDATFIIMSTLTKYPDIKLRTINLAIRGEIHLYFTYKNETAVIPAYLPVSKLEEKLKSLNLFLINHPAADLQGKILDLRFKDMLIASSIENPDDPETRTAKPK